MLLCVPVFALMNNDYDKIINSFSSFLMYYIICIACYILMKDKYKDVLFFPGHLYITSVIITYSQGSPSFLFKPLVATFAFWILWKSVIVYMVMRQFFV